LPQTNESATVAKSKIFLKLNKALEQLALHLSKLKAVWFIAHASHQVVAPPKAVAWEMAATCVAEISMQMN
jgi:hypothetical protein